MMHAPHWIVLGLSITSSWGNGHATTYRGLLKALAARGNRVTFLERDVPWYAAHRDATSVEGVDIALYADLAGLWRRFATDLQRADVVLLGSYVPEGATIGDWLLAHRPSRLTAFYDIDTPITLARFDAGADCEYVRRDQLARYDCYFSFAGGRALERLRALGVPQAATLYCAVDTAAHPATDLAPRWDLGYLGTYAADRQPALETLLTTVAARRPSRQFVVAGPLYPPGIAWPSNVERLEHVAPPEHPAFYAGQRYTLNLTRDDMRALGHAPSVRLFEAAACGTPVISDRWPGLEELFTPGDEILLAGDAAEVETYLEDIPEEQRRTIAERARIRVLHSHTAAHRAAELERALFGSIGRPAGEDAPGTGAVTGGRR